MQLTRKEGREDERGYGRKGGRVRERSKCRGYGTNAEAMEECQLTSVLSISC